MIFENVDVAIETGRWNVYMTIRDRDSGREYSFVASAASYYTENDGIFFGTQEEWDNF